MKTDEQFLEEVNFLYDSLASTHPDLLGAYESFIEAGEAFLAEAEGKADPGRLDRLRQTYEKATTRTRAYYMTQVSNLKVLDNVLRSWRSPGRDYQQHVDRARAAHSEYVNAMNASAAEIDRISLAIKDFDTRRR
jgi:hypothetical protein